MVLFLIWPIWRMPDVQGANLQGANLTQVILRGANLAGANLEPDNMAVEASLHHSDLSGANLEKTKLDGVLYDSHTKFPVGFNPTEHGMVLDENPDVSF